MAISPKNNSLAFVAEVARYLSVEPPDIQRMIRLAKLPAIKIPKATRPVFRIPLRDFHVWLVSRTTNPAPELANYEKFLKDFDQVRQRPGKKAE